MTALQAGFRSRLSAHNKVTLTQLRTLSGSAEQSNFMWHLGLVPIKQTSVGFSNNN